MSKITKGLFCLLLTVASGCTNKDGAQRVLHQQGYTDIQIKGYAVWGCSEDGSVKTAFKATSPNGNRVEGVVCEGLLFKGKTVRLK